MKMILITFAVLFTSNTLLAQVTDEIIVDSKVTGRAWDAEIAQNHEVWRKPACSAYTLSSDGVSSLEVVAFYDAGTDTFSEPEVNVVTEANFSFLDVQATTDGTSQNFQLLPIQPANPALVGARVLFDDREDMVSAIRRHNTLTARYLDSSGEVKKASFSLRGSSNAVGAAFERCGLEFLPELELPTPL